MDNNQVKRGFAAMDPVLQRAIASKGGKAAHLPGGGGHQFNSDEGRLAGKKGGAIVSRDRAHMAEIGRLGGKSRGRKFASRSSVVEYVPAIPAILPIKD